MSTKFNFYSYNFPKYITITNKELKIAKDNIFIILAIPDDEK